MHHTCWKFCFVLLHHFHVKKTWYSHRWHCTLTNLGKFFACSLYSLDSTMCNYVLLNSFLHPLPSTNLLDMHIPYCFIHVDLLIGFSYRFLGLLHYITWILGVHLLQMHHCLPLQIAVLIWRYYLVEKYFWSMIQCFHLP